jgi:hypothetical protein
MKLKPIFKSQKNRAAAKAAFEGRFDDAFGLVERGADINAVYYFGEPEEGGGVGNIGYSAIAKGDVAALEKALERGLDKNLSGYGRPPLVVFAIMHKQEAAATLLVNKGAEVNDFLLSDFFSPLALTRIYDMPQLGRLIESKLSPAQLAAARAADIPSAKTQNNSKPFNT